MLASLMDDQQPTPPIQGAPRDDAPQRTGPWPLVLRTASKAWDGNIFSEAAEAAFWQTLSLPPLLLGLLGSLGYLGDWFGPHIVVAVQDKIIGFCRTVFSSNVVETIIQPTVTDILTKSHSEIASFGFLLSLWAGSSAMSSFVDAITVAYQQYGVRNEVLQRLFALLLYLIGLVLAVIGLPVLALGPNYLPKVFPAAWQPTVSSLGNTFYYPVVAILLAIALATLYKVALPRRYPWFRGLPGAALAMVVFLLASIGIRIYLLWIGKTGYTYGALAAPIAFLLFTFFIGLAIVIGAYFNSAIQDMWPAKPTRRARRKWRRLEMVRATERAKEEKQDKPADDD
jgi:membrane protein